MLRYGRISIRQRIGEGEHQTVSFFQEEYQQLPADQARPEYEERMRGARVAGMFVLVLLVGVALGGVLGMSLSSPEQLAPPPANFAGHAATSASALQSSSSGHRPAGHPPARHHKRRARSHHSHAQSVQAAVPRGQALDCGTQRI
jgi:hypothetical protein